MVNGLIVSVDVSGFTVMLTAEGFPVIPFDWSAVSASDRRLMTTGMAAGMTDEGKLFLLKSVPASSAASASL